MIEIIIAVSAAVVILTCLIIFLLLHFGIIFSYHPMKKAKDGQIRVACVGDSITYGFMVRNWRKNNYPSILNELLGKAYCVNSFSYTNRTAVKNGDYPLVNEKVYKQSLDFNPDIVIILLGTNDSKENNWNADQFVADYGEMIESYLALESSPKVYVILPPPVFEIGGKVLYQIRKSVIEEELIPAVKRIAEIKNVGCIDMYKAFEDRKDMFCDGVHPNAKGSRLFAQIVYETIKSDMYNGR